MASFFLCIPGICVKNCVISCIQHRIMKIRRIALISLPVIAIIIFFVLTLKQGKKENFTEVSVSSGKFEIVVNVTGELEAEHSEEIQAPEGLRTIRLWNVKITDLVPEGTIVKAGDYVATLDRTEASNNLKDIEADIDKLEADLVRKKLDTTLELGQLRDNLLNLKYSLEEQKIRYEQSKFEPPATIRQEEINYEKAQRNLQQSSDNYKLKEQQAKADIQQALIYLNNQKRKRDNIVLVLEQFVVKAPKPGMVIYAREWNGAKRKVGGMVSPWEPTVATLPDMSSMISMTYINEIDISKVKMGQKARIGIDAFPGREYTGEVIEVANVGEQLPNTDAKVFQVKIKLHHTDSILKPAMTTSNALLTAVFDSVMFIPLEAVHSTDSNVFVYIKTPLGFRKRRIETGDSNENHIIVRKGLKPDERILLSVPENAEKITFEMMK